MDIIMSTESLLGMCLIVGSISTFFDKRYNLDKSPSTGDWDEILNENEKLKLILSTSHKEAKMASWFWDVEKNEISWSTEMYEIFELSKEIGPSIDSIRDLIINEDQSDYDDAIQKSISKSGPIPTRIQYRIKTKSGILKHISAKGSVIRDSDGNASKIIGTVQDITNQSEAAEYLNQTKNNYELLTETLPLGIYRAKIDTGKILFVNETMLELFGASSEEEFLCLSTPSLYKDSEDRQKFLSELRSKKRLLDYRVELCRQDGSSFVAEINCLEKDGEIHGIIHDSSIKSQIESEKNELIGTLKSQNDDLEKFAYIISHNLRSPLANIMGLTQLIDKDSLSNQNKEVIELLGVSTNNLDLIIKDLNHIVSIRESKNNHYELIQIGKIVDQIIENHSEEIISKQIQINSNISTNDQIHCISGFIDGILENLIDNAIKFYDVEKGRRSIHISFEKKANTYDIKVEDNGVGFEAKQNTERLFKLYEKFDSDLPGRGVGLYKTYNQVNVLKGKISVCSKRLKGTSIHIELPRY
ncbi:PAS domain-containing sensor histidine kinase [Reichenbachiella versicolor]|uniref:PAS domain-containing sensor histidine kinase n=1 Tax=Reichenbachiella versicolor TaxID=1821036 RepID=UPI000D6E2AC8|nr:PAS domain-containing sensor histidine kinase [Reichenbachiella versicolor]